MVLYIIWLTHRVSLSLGPYLGGILSRWWCLNEDGKVKYTSSDLTTSLHWCVLKPIGKLRQLQIWDYMYKHFVNSNVLSNYWTAIFFWRFHFCQDPCSLGNGLDKGEIHRVNKPSTFPHPSDMGPSQYLIHFASHLTHTTTLPMFCHDIDKKRVRARRKTDTALPVWNWPHHVLDRYYPLPIRHTRSNDTIVSSFPEQKHVEKSFHYSSKEAGLKFFLKETIFSPVKPQQVDMSWIDLLGIFLTY